MATIDDLPVISQYEGDLKASRSPSVESIEKKDPVRTSTSNSEAASIDLRDPEEEPPRFTDWLLRRRRFKAHNPDAVATVRSVYDDPDLAPHYWPKKTYENIRRFDPTARWTFAEEKKIVHKLDWYVMFWAAITFSALNIDRGNIS
jgi:hypothetical protein